MEAIFSQSPSFKSTNCGKKNSHFITKNPRFSILREIKFKNEELFTICFHSCPTFLVGLYNIS